MSLEIQFIRRSTQQITCIACKGEGKHFNQHVCYICNGKGTVPIQVEKDITDMMYQLKPRVLKYDFDELFTNKP